MVNFKPEPGGDGSIVIRRLHRLVRHGYRPWLGHDVASGQDRDVHLRRNDGVATIQPDGSVVFRATVTPAARRLDGHDPVGDQDVTIAGDDDAGFDARLPANTPNKRNIMRRLYEVGFLAG